MGTVGDLAGVGAIAVVGYFGYKYLTGKKQNVRNSSSSASNLQPSEQAKKVIGGFEDLQQNLTDATYIKQEVKDTLDVAAGSVGGVTKLIYDIGTNSIIGDILGIKERLNGALTKTSQEYVLSPAYQNSTKDAAETTNTATTTSLQELRSAITNTDGLTASQKRDLERSLRNKVV